MYTYYIVVYIFTASIYKWKYINQAFRRYALVRKSVLLYDFVSS